MYHPTAVQADAELHETPSSSAVMSSAGLGVAWVAQAVPFQRSASVRVTPDFAVYHRRRYTGRPMGRTPPSARYPGLLAAVLAG
jgi:hypothetical protein